MIKLKSEKQGKEYLVEVYDVLKKDLRFDHEFYAMVDVVNKMYSFDMQLATEWTTFLINRYGIQGVRDAINEFDYEADIRSFIDDLLRGLMEHYTFDGIIKLIHEQVSRYDVRQFLWTYLFSPNREKNKFIVYFDEIIQDKKYTTAYEMVSMIMDNQVYIPCEIFDSTHFLNDIIANYTNRKEKIEDQQLLDLLYSFVDLIPTEHGKAVLKSNFVDYL